MSRQKQPAVARALKKPASRPRASQKGIRRTSSARERTVEAASGQAPRWPFEARHVRPRHTGPVERRHGSVNTHDGRNPAGRGKSQYLDTIVQCHVVLRFVRCVLRNATVSVMVMCLALPVKEPMSDFFMP